MIRSIDEDGKRTKVYRNNVTRPGLEYRSNDPREFLSRNYREVEGLVRYQCEVQGCEEWGDDFRGWFFTRYITGTNNYHPRKGDISKFLYQAVFFELNEYRKQMVTASRQVPVGLRVKPGRVVGEDMEAEYEARHDMELFAGVLEGRGMVEDLFWLLEEGYSREEAARIMGVSSSTIHDNIVKLRDLYRRWVGHADED